MNGTASPALAFARHAAGSAFQPSTSVRIGAELEWLVFDPVDLSRPVPAEETQRVAAGPLPGGGAVTIEPGGQLELVTQPFVSPEQLTESINTDVATLVERFGRHGLILVTLGLDPVRPPHRSLEVPRYAAMERYFRAHSPAGVTMMCSTASLQLNIDMGPDPHATWQRADALRPALEVIFANSPTADGKTFVRSSARQNVWGDTDPTRTTPVGIGRGAWLDYILDAHVMFREHDGIYKPQLDALSLRDWAEEDSPPSVTDIERHITTLFPPLRPRGYLEFRMIDALPEVGRTAAIATVWALMTSEDTGRRVDAIVDDPDIDRVAAECLTIAADATELTSPPLAEACRTWRDQYQFTSATGGSVDDLITNLTER